MHRVRKTFVLAALLGLCISGPAAGQHFLTAGARLGLRFFDSRELNLFKDTYNIANADNLADLMDGFDGQEGIGFEIGYRYWKRYTAGISFGWMTFNRKDNATFNNNETRVLKLKSNRFNLDYEAGRPFGDFFINGVLSFFFKRDVEMQAEYFDANGQKADRRLNGNYDSTTDLSGALGIAVGMYRKPIFLVGRITYPFFATDESERLRDDSAAKQADGSALFPDDYINFRAREPYDGVPNKLDGWKISLAVVFSLEL